MKKFIDYIPKKKQHYVEEFYKCRFDGDYWLYVKEEFWVEDMGCRTIHENSIKKVLDVFKSVRVAREDEL